MSDYELGSILRRIEDQENYGNGYGKWYGRDGGTETDATDSDGVRRTLMIDSADADDDNNHVRFHYRYTTRSLSVIG